MHPDRRLDAGRLLPVPDQLAVRPQKDTILFIDPGFPVQRQQVRILGIKHESFDIYDFRAEKLGPKLESYLKQGNVAAIIYSNPNNPAWICLTESELRTIGELATKYDTIVLEDLAYMGMDFRKELGHPFQAPFQATAARYTDNYVLMISGSKIFSYAGQRIAIAAISDKLRNRFYPALKERYGIGRFAESYALTFLYAASSGASHSAQYALAAMFKAAADGKLDFVGHTREYAHRAHRVKELFERHGFHIVYDKDQDEHVSDGFFFTVGYGSMPSSDLVAALFALRYLRDLAHLDGQPPERRARLRVADEPRGAVRPARPAPPRLRAGLRPEINPALQLRVAVKSSRSCTPEKRIRHGHPGTTIRTQRREGAE